MNILIGIIIFLAVASVTLYALYYRLPEDDPTDAELDTKDRKPVIMRKTDKQEVTAGFMDLDTGEFCEVMVIRSDSDIDTFMNKYDLYLALVIEK